MGDAHKSCGCGEYDADLEICECEKYSTEYYDCVANARGRCTRVPKRFMAVQSVEVEEQENASGI